MNSVFIDQLERINWNFGTKKIVSDGAVYPFNNRKFHSYPATYIPEIPFTIVEILSKEGDVVLDPFGGIGTTFVQALIQKRIPISIDNNTIASNITRDFFSLFNPQTDISIAETLILEKISVYEKNMDYTSNLEDKQRELFGWYEKNTLNELSFLITVYDELIALNENKGLICLFHLCLSNVLTTVCSQNGGWAYIADNVKPKNDCFKDKRPIERFRSAMGLCVKSIQYYKEILGNEIASIYSDERFTNVVCDNFVNCNIDELRGKVNLVVTSPPYPKMIDYVKSQRLSYYVEKKDFTDDLATEIGARARRNKPNAIESYISDMTICNAQIYDCLVKKGILCYVLPMFPDEGRDVERKRAIDCIIEDCKQRGFVEVYQKERCIPGTQRSNNIKWASLKKELIVVMEKS